MKRNHIQWGLATLLMKVWPVYKTALWCPRGHFNQDQAGKYADLCRRFQPNHVLETGFCTGRSAVSVLYYTTLCLRRMISIDKDLDYRAPEGRQMAGLLKKKFPRFEVVEQPAQEILTPEFFRREFPGGVDWATIDGDHSYEGCSFDLDAIAPFLSDRGMMVVDDYQSGKPNGVRFDSVTRSVDDFLARQAGAFQGETWNKDGKGFCILKKV